VFNEYSLLEHAFMVLKNLKIQNIKNSREIQNLSFEYSIKSLSKALKHNTV